jgi:nucleotide-binding universal stress UspA family protein
MNTLSMRGCPAFPEKYGGVCEFSIALCETVLERPPTMMRSYRPAVNSRLQSDHFRGRPKSCKPHSSRKENCKYIATGVEAVLRTVLVPLDRSPLAEQALPFALQIARRAGATLDLVSAHMLYALEDPGTGRLPYDAAREAEFRQCEQRYLDTTAARLATAHAVPIRTAVIDGPVANALLERQCDCPADLIVMTTHGRGPVGRAILGSVADELIRRAPVPVMVVHPSDESDGGAVEPILNHILITLDGSPLAEQILKPAVEIARLLGARCTLLRVIESAETASVHPSSGPWPPSQSAALDYLETSARNLRDQRLRVDARVVVGRHAAVAILEQAHQQPGNIIALATHGRGGVRRMLLGSVADKVLRGSAVPVLVFRPR